MYVCVYIYSGPTHVRVLLVLACLPTQAYHMDYNWHESRLVNPGTRKSSTLNFDYCSNCHRPSYISLGRRSWRRGGGEGGREKGKARGDSNSTHLRVWGRQAGRPANRQREWSIPLQAGSAENKMVPAAWSRHERNTSGCQSQQRLDEMAPVHSNAGLCFLPILGHKNVFWKLEKVGGAHRSGIQCMCNCTPHTLVPIIGIGTDRQVSERTQIWYKTLLSQVLSKDLLSHHSEIWFKPLFIFILYKCSNMCWLLHHEFLLCTSGTNFVPWYH